MTDRPRESDPTDRPSDAVTGKVVARWKGWSAEPKCRWAGTRNAFQNQSDPYDFADDPRESTDAALELLGHLEQTGDIDDVQLDYYWTENSDGITGSCWEVQICENDPEMGMGDTEYLHLPLSGEGLCYAVVHLAAKVWGVEDKEGDE